MLDTKDTHAKVRCSSLSKAYSVRTLKAHELTLSEAYDGLNSGRGLVSLQDRTVSRLLSDAMRHFRKAAIEYNGDYLLSLTADGMGEATKMLKLTQRNTVKPFVAETLERLTRVVKTLSQGRAPLYLQDIWQYQNIRAEIDDLDNFYLLQLRENALEHKTEKETLEEYMGKTVMQLAQDAQEYEYIGRPVWEGLKKMFSFDSDYWIRFRKDELPAELILEGSLDRAAFSRKTRMMLGYIHDIPSQTDGRNLSEARQLVSTAQTFRGDLLLMPEYGRVQDISDEVKAAVGKAGEGVERFIETIGF